MRRYSDDQEAKLYARNVVQRWTRARLLTPEQTVRIARELAVGLKEVNEFFRVGLAVFAFFVVWSLFFLILSPMTAPDSLIVAAVMLLLSLAAIVGAESLIAGLKFYRHGVEEALVVSAAMFAGGAAAAALSNSRPASGEVVAIGLIVGAMAALAAYWRYGYVYMAIAGIGGAALAGFPLPITDASARMIAAAVLTAAFLIARWKRHGSDAEWRRDEYSAIQAAAGLGLYVALNVKIGFAVVSGPFYWFTYGMTLVLPVVGLLLAVRDKDRALLDVAIVTTLLTLVTNKPYLGLVRHEWDPILLGVLLLATVFGVRRWLSVAPGGHRGGFTAVRIDADQKALLTALSAIPFGMHAHAGPAHPQPSGFDGGRSGGGGTDAGF